MKSLCESCSYVKGIGQCQSDYIDTEIVNKCGGYKKIDKAIKELVDFVNKPIKDSGERTEFSTGAVRDMHVGKGRYDLLPWNAIHQLAIHCENGAIKYGERNCEKGIPVHSLLDSAVRHLSCYLRGQKEENHLRAAMWNVSMAIEIELNHPELQDIPVRLE